MFGCLERSEAMVCITRSRQFPYMQACRYLCLSLPLTDVFDPLNIMLWLCVRRFFYLAVFVDGVLVNDV